MIGSQWKTLYPTMQQAERPAEELQIEPLTPVSSPATLIEAKAYLHVDFADDDALIGSLLTMATEKAQQHCNRTFLTQQLMAHWYRFFEICKLPRPPHQLISLVEYREHAVGCQWITIDPSEYIQSGAEQFTIRTSLIFTPLGYEERELRVTYLAGYGIYEAQVPQPIIIAIEDMVAFAYEHRGESDAGSIMTPLAKSLLSPYRVITQ